MFGYVRPALDQLSEEQQEAYRGAYCGLYRAQFEDAGALEAARAV